MTRVRGLDPHGLKALLGAWTAAQAAGGIDQVLLEVHRKYMVATMRSVLRQAR